MLPNTKYSLKNLPKNFKIVPNWQNIAKSGHIVGRSRNSSRLPGIRDVMKLRMINKRRKDIVEKE